MSKKPRGIFRHFIWKIRNRKFVEVWDRFRKIAIINSQDPGVYLEKVVTRWMEAQDAQGLPAFTPVYENQLMRELCRRGLGVSKVTLRKWRNNGDLEQKDGDKPRPFWFTDGNTVVYDLESVIEVAREKKRARV